MRLHDRGPWLALSRFNGPLLAASIYPHPWTYVHAHYPCRSDPGRVEPFLRIWLVWHLEWLFYTLPQSVKVSDVALRLPLWTLVFLQWIFASLQFSFLWSTVEKHGSSLPPTGKGFLTSPAA